MINRLPKCKECKDRFVPYNNNSLQKFCMNKDKCIEAHLKFCKDKKEAAETKAVNKRSKN